MGNSGSFQFWSAKAGAADVKRKIARMKDILMAVFPLMGLAVTVAHKPIVMPVEAQKLFRVRTCPDGPIEPFLCNNCKSLVE
jgi:hypothetical protein